jgi:hypothetical protein
MSENKTTNNWYPEIMYEEDSKIPFVPVPENERMPSVLFMFESRETGEHEPGPDGEPLPIVQMDLHQYASMNILKERTTPQQYDNIRLALGLEPLALAAKKGAKLSKNVRNAVENVN